MLKKRGIGPAKEIILVRVTYFLMELTAGTGLIHLEDRWRRDRSGLKACCFRVVNRSRQDYSTSRGIGVGVRGIRGLIQCERKKQRNKINEIIFIQFNYNSKTTSWTK